jgi:hypothetical protein
MNDEEPSTRSGEEWRKAEAFSRKLAATGDTPTSFFVKRGIGCVVLASIGILVLWFLYRAVRGLLGQNESQLDLDGRHAGLRF